MDSNNAILTIKSHADIFNSYATRWVNFITKHPEMDPEASLKAFCGECLSYLHLVSDVR